MQIQAKLPDDLDELLTRVEIDAGGLIVSSLVYEENNLEILIKVVFSQSEEPELVWKISALNVEKEFFVRNWTERMELFTSHPLLNDFQEDYAELYYRGKTENSEKLFIDLFRLFSEGNWKDIKFGEGINAPDGFLNLCNQETGLFARGSQSRLHAYASILQDNHIETNILTCKTNEEKHPKLLTLGDSYFIAQDFIFQRIR